MDKETGTDHISKEIIHTSNWIKNVVIGCNFCPFAAKALLKKTVRYVVVENTDFTTTEKQKNSPKIDWAIHQIRTTSNFGTKSKWLSWILGGLNFQVEHHLFPRISHIHYPKISEIVRSTCKEYSIKYNEFPTMLGAVISHLGHLRRVGVA